MKQVVKRVGYALMLSFLFVVSCEAQQSIEGDWIGGFKLKGQWTAVHAHFKSEQEVIKGSADIQSSGGTKKNLNLSQVSLAGSRLRFEMPQDSGVFAFEGQLKGTRLSGKFQGGGVQGVFELLRTTKIDPRDFRRYVGAYRIGPKQFISFGRFKFGDGSDSRIRVVDTLSYGDSFSGRRGDLIPLSETTFIIGPAIGSDYPADIRIDFIKNRSGEITGLKWRRGGIEKTATRIKLREEEVRFSNGDVTLAGSLVMPVTGGPHPALVLIHGSTPLVRYYHGAAPYLYAAYGIAVLFYDKRGCGESGGKFSGSLPIETLAADAIAGVEYLKTRPDINPNQIGVHGHSQGGWVAPAAAVMSKDVAFVMAGAASGWPTQDNVVYELDGDLRFAGFSENERARARALFKMGNDVILAGGEGWNEWREEIRKAKGEKWFPMARTPPSLIEMNDANRARILEWVARERQGAFDPVPVWEKVTVPVVVYEGELDRFVPAKESAVIIAQALKKAGNKDYTIKIFPKASHGMWAVETGGPLDRLTYQIHHEYLMNWLLNHVTVPK